jgi:hypothetical protein
MSPRDKRDKLIASLDRGIITESEAHNSFIGLILDADDDAAALNLCNDLPDTFRTSFRGWLSDLSERDYLFRWFGIGDSRTAEQVDADAKRYQQILTRLGPTMLELL